MKKKIVYLPADPMPGVQVPGDLSRGVPDKTMWPKMPMRFGDEEIVVDVLVRLDYPGHKPQIVVVELEATPESRQRERLLIKMEMPVIRLTLEDLRREDFMPNLDRKLREAASQGTGRITRVLGLCA